MAACSNRKSINAPSPRHIAIPPAIENFPPWPPCAPSNMAEFRASAGQKNFDAQHGRQLENQFRAVKISTCFIGTNRQDAYRYRIAKLSGSTQALQGLAPAVSHGRLYEGVGSFKAYAFHIFNIPNYGFSKLQCQVPQCYDFRKNFCLLKIGTCFRDVTAYAVDKVEP